MTLAMIENKIAELEQRELDRVRCTFEDYRSLVQQSLDGEPDVDWAAQVLSDVGKSCQDLENDVRVLEQRRNWAAMLATEGSIAEEARAIESTLGRLRTERQRAVETIDRQIGITAAQRAALTDRQSAVGAARSHLIATAPAELAGFEAELRQQLRGLGSERQLAAIERKRLEQQADNLRRLRDNENNSKNPLHVNDNQRQHYADSVRHIEQTIAGQDRHLQELAAAGAELQAQLDEILERKLTP